MSDEEFDKYDEKSAPKTLSRLDYHLQKAQYDSTERRQFLNVFHEAVNSTDFILL